MTYGSLFSTKLIVDGRYDEAISTATAEIVALPDEPEPYFNRGQAYAALDRFEEAIADYEAALRMDMSGSSVDPEAVDDELFSAMKALAVTRASDPAFAIRTLARYSELLPQGRHADDVAKWVDHWNGVEVVWVRERA